MGAWDTRYEALRDEGLSHRVTGGVVLVSRQGLLAWLRAERFDDTVLADISRVPRDASRPAVVNRELVAAFVELIRNRRPEGKS